MSLTTSAHWMYNAGGGFYDHEIDGSLRFNDDDNANLSRTFGSTSNRATWTWSGWVKRGNLGVDQSIFGTQSGGSNIGYIAFDSNNKLDLNNKLNDSTGVEGNSTRLFRDVGAWYHLVIVFDGNQSNQSDRFSIYVNGESDTFVPRGSKSAGNGYINTAVIHGIGYRAEENNWYYDGYMAEVNFIDGQALDASSFGETKSGIWIPKEYSGSYGTNGFHLEFAGNANDTSGNGNNWTANNISAYDYVPDSPTNNFATLMIHNHAAANSNAFSEGNLRFTPGTGDSARNTNRQAISNMLVSSGKWYAEAYIVDNGGSHFIGVGPKQTVSPTSNNTRYAYVYSSSGQSYVNTNGSESISTYASSYTVGDVIGIYVDMDAATPVVYFSKNGQWSNGSGSWNQSSPSGGITLGGTFFTESADFPGTFTFHAARASGSYSPTTIWNFGQDDTFTGNITAGGNADANGYGSFKYSPPTDALALCTANLPAPAIDPADDATPEDYFNTLLWTGTGSTNALTGVGFQPDLVWIKQRNAAQNHVLHDVIRGAGKYIMSDNSSAEATNTNQLSSFDADGFTVNTAISTNGSGSTYVGWNWKAGGTGVSNTDGSITSTVSANTDAGFSVVTWTGTSGTDTIGHGLGTAPALIITKPRSADNWIVYHKDMGATKQLYLDLTNAQETNSNIYSVVPTSSVFTIGSWSSTRNLVSYCFAEKEGYSKIGSYTGNGSTDGTFIYTGFRPAFVLTKKSSASGEWVMWDNRRSGYNVDNDFLYANATNSEYNGATYPRLDLVSNGFKMRDNSADTNGSGATYIYLAFAEQPFKYANAR